MLDATNPYLNSTYRRQAGGALFPRRQLGGNEHRAVEDVVIACLELGEVVSRQHLAR